MRDYTSSPFSSLVLKADIRQRHACANYLSLFSLFHPLPAKKGTLRNEGLVSVVVIMHNLLVTGEEPYSLGHRPPL